MRVEGERVRLSTQVVDNSMAITSAQPWLKNDSKRINETRLQDTVHITINKINKSCRPVPSA